eukprot:3867075-Rhodomonas_salina.1
MLAQISTRSLLLWAVLAVSSLSPSQSFTAPHAAFSTANRFMLQTPMLRRENMCVSMSTDGDEAASSQHRLALARRDFHQRTIFALGSAALATFAPQILTSVCKQEAAALCGAKPSSWEFWIPWDEQGVPTSSGTEGAAGSGERLVFYRV